MKPLTNSEIAARRPKLTTHNGQRTQVSNQKLLFRSHSLVWTARGAEIRDSAEAVIFRGTFGECQAEAMRRGLWY